MGELSYFHLEFYSHSYDRNLLAVCPSTLCPGCLANVSKELVEMHHEAMVVLGDLGSDPNQSTRASPGRHGGSGATSVPRILKPPA